MQVQATNSYKCLSDKDKLQLLAIIDVNGIAFLTLS